MAYLTVLTDVGEAWVVDKIDTATKADYVAWGTGATEAAKGQTTLVTESAETRIQGTATQPSADIYQVVATLTSLSDQTIQEAGLFNAVTVGTMVIRGNFAGVALLTGDKIEFTISLEIT